MKLYPECSNVRNLYCSLTMSAMFCACVAASAQAPLEPVQMATVTADGPMVLADLAAAGSATQSAEVASFGEPAGLPDSPGVVSVPDTAASTNFSAEADPSTRPAPRYAKYIEPEETTQPLSGGEKVALSLRELYSPLSLAGFLSGAGWEQLVNGSPNYGTDRGAFGQRLGAAAIRGSAQTIFTDGVFSPLLQMDPRYYIEGSKYSFGHRVVYAATRVFVVRTDSGRKTFNSPLWLGYAASSALTPLYYPEINRNFKDVASDYGGSLGGAAIGFVVSEFLESVLRVVHMGGKD